MWKCCLKEFERDVKSNTHTESVGPRPPATYVGEHHPRMHVANIIVYIIGCLNVTVALPAQCVMLVII